MKPQTVAPIPPPPGYHGSGSDLIVEAALAALFEDEPFGAKEKARILEGTRGTLPSDIFQSWGRAICGASLGGLAVFFFQPFDQAIFNSLGLLWLVGSFCHWNARRFRRRGL